MGLFGRWFVSTRGPYVELERLGGMLDRFAALSMASVPPETFARHPRKQRNAIAFHFGAIDHLVAQEPLGETELLALYVRFLQTHPVAGMPETVSVTHLLEEFMQDDERKRYRQEGREAMQQWMLSGNENAPRRLAGMLRMIQG